MNISKNYTILTTSLFDTAACNVLAQDEYIQDTGFMALKPGWNVVVLYLWVAQKVQFASKDVMSQLNKIGKGITQERLVVNLLKLAKRDTVVMENLPLGVYGGQITTPKPLSYTTADMKKVMELFQGCPLTEYLAKQIPARYSGNILATKKLNKLISLIDFKIPSISCLLQTLGYSFLNNNPFLEDGVVVGETNQAGTYYVYYDKYYKLLNSETLAALAAEGLLKHPLSIMQCTQLNIVTNHLQEV